MPKQAYKFFAVLLALVFIVISAPVQTAQAAVVLTVEPSSGQVGDVVTVSGSGLYLGQTAMFRLYFTDKYVDLSEGDKYVEDELTSYCYYSVTNIVGDSFTQTVTIPAFFNNKPVDEDGTYYFYITKLNGMIGKYVFLQGTTFEITGFSEMTLTPTQGNVGSELEIEGQGFWPGEDLQILFDGIDITEDYVSGEPKAASSGTAGTFDVVVPVPATSYGEKGVKVIGEDSSVEVTRTFTVRPNITLSPVEGGADIQIIVRGTGFDKDVDIFFGNALIVQSGEVEENGRFTEIINIPEGTAPGTYAIKAEDTVRPATINASTNFEVILLLEPSIILDPQGETVGSVIDISGVEFENSKPITLTINDQPVTPDSPITSTSSGTFSGSFVIPELPSGTHTVEASSGLDVSASATFTVTHEASLGKTSGRAGEQVSVSGTGFKANTAVTVTFDDETVSLDAASPKTDANGSFSYSFDVPIVAEGTHNVVITVGSASVTRTFATDMDMTIAPATGKAGTEVVITASGFAPDSSAVISFGNTVLTTATTSANGSLSVVFTVPAVAEGTYPVKVEVSGISATKDFTASAEVAFTPTSGNVGDQVSITGTGFGSTKPLTLTWDGDSIGGGSLTTTAEGAFNVAFNVPPVQGGSYTISVSDGTITKTQTFTVSQSTPPVPQPVSPGMYSKQNGNVTFDWNPVDYEVMDVTYDLQVARDTNFTTPVISKTGLTADQYALTEAEKLVKAGEDNPYYWRVRAVDEAGNTSDWSGAGEFYYGSGWPTWLTWVLIGLGVVVLGILAFWVGRRIAYYSY